jgi:Sigma 54 modulation/S30EA ribosomal protein C terminus
MRRSADRRRVHRGSRTPTSVAAATSGLGLDGVAVATLERSAEPEEGDEFGGLVVREKEHPAEPMSIDRALYEMELVGHDFYLFADADTGRPTVVYRRKGYDYGVIRLVDGG